MKAHSTSARRRFAAGLGPWLLVLAAIGFAAFVRLRLADMPLERDEGEYAYAGQLMLQGIPPYQLAFTAKWPGTHLMYALSLAVLGQTEQAVRLGLLLVNAVSVVLVFLLGRQLLGAWAGAAAAASYGWLSLSCQVLGLAAHATHFVVLFALGGLLLLLAMSRARTLLVVFGAGLCFGLAMLMKQHGALFGVFGMVWLIKTEWAVRPSRALVRRLLVYLAGWALPLVAVCVWVAVAGVWDAFWFWTFRYARAYVGVNASSTGVQNLMVGLQRATHGALGFWALALAGLGLLWRPGQPDHTRLFLSGMVVAATIAVSPALVFRDHYFILFLPALALLAGAALKRLYEMLAARNRPGLGKIFPTALLLGAALHLTWTQRAPWFELDPVLVSRWSYGFNPFPETRQIGLFLREQAGPNDRIAVIGSEPQVYFYARRRSATGYIYMYPLVEGHALAPVW